MWDDDNEDNSLKDFRKKDKRKVYQLENLLPAVGRDRLSFTFCDRAGLCKVSMLEFAFTSQWDKQRERSLITDQTTNQSVCVWGRGQVSPPGVKTKPKAESSEVPAII